jgi:hypothetical protein
MFLRVRACEGFGQASQIIGRNIILKQIIIGVKKGYPSIFKTLIGLVRGFRADFCKTIMNVPDYKYLNFIGKLNPLDL